MCTKLSYSFYLTQFPVFFYNVGRVRTSIHYSLINTFVSSFIRRSCDLKEQIINFWFSAGFQRDNGDSLGVNSVDAVRRTSMQQSQVPASGWKQSSTKGEANRKHQTKIILILPIRDNT